MTDVEKAKFVYSFGAIKNPKCPHTEKINKLKYGDHLFFRGSIHPNCKRFDFNFLGQLPGKRREIALHLTVRFDHKTIVRNNTENGKWGPEEVTKGTGPLNTGGRFDISFLVLEDKFRIAINRGHLADFKYRMPLESISAFKIEGDVTVDSIHIQPGYETAKLMPNITLMPTDPMKPSEKQETIEKSPSSGEKKLGKLPICYGYLLKVPFMGEIPGGMIPGRTVFATIIPAKASSRWTINLWTSRTSKKNLPLHFNVRHDCRNVVMNSTDASGKWQDELVLSHLPVQCGRHTDVIIICEKERYIISLYNHHLAEFKHRYTKLEDIKFLTVEGDCSLIHIRVQ